jgi:hypothetical protein
VLQVQCTGNVPTVSVDKCDGVQAYIPHRLAANPNFQVWLRSNQLVTTVAVPPGLACNQSCLPDWECSDVKACHLLHGSPHVYCYAANQACLLLRLNSDMIRFEQLSEGCTAAGLRVNANGMLLFASPAGGDSQILRGEPAGAGSQPAPAVTERHNIVCLLLCALQVVTAKSSEVNLLVLAAHLRLP